MDLLEQQGKLQKEARQVMGELGLVELLREYGQVNIVGSLASGLMTWKDIDIEVVVEKITLEDISKLTSKLINQGHKRIDFGIVDNRKKEATVKTPKGIYLGIKCYDLAGADVWYFENNKGVWKLDIHFVLKEDARGRVFTEQLKDKITDENRRIILDIKNELTKNPKHRKEIFSVDVYRAVLDEGIKDLEGFKKYLQRSNREF